MSEDSMKFNYKKYNHRTRPVIPVRIVHKDVSLQYEVLVDSGADFCLFHAELAEALGVNLAQGLRGIARGVGGKSSYILQEVAINVAGCENLAIVGFLTDSESRNAPYGIVGQEGFFDSFKILFNREKEEIELQTI
jgi:hypothetical protein